MRAILLGISYKNLNNDLAYSLHELKALAKTLDYEIVYILSQNKDKADSATYIGSGKVIELKELIHQYKADVVIVDDQLTPTQNKNLCDMLEVEVIDRTYLILQIFSLRAKTNEAKCEIALAENYYLLNRTFLKKHELSREGGSGAFNNKGKGETSRELNRRHLEANILRLRQELEQIRQKKDSQMQRRKKNGVPVVALVGYTNAGKSSTLNSIVDYIGDNKEKKVYEKDELFATLDTFSRRLTYKNLPFILTDTIGFVSKLPPTLINSFYQTLAEAKEADLIIYVVDISSKYAFSEFLVTYNVIKEIGANHIPFLLLFTKIDKAEPQPAALTEIINYVVHVNKSNVVYKEFLYTLISNKTKSGIPILVETIFKNLSSNYNHIYLNVPYSNGKLINFIEEKANIISKTYLNDYIYYDLYISEKYYNAVAKFEADNLIT